MNVLNRSIVAAMPLVPRPIVRRIASRYVAVAVGLRRQLVAAGHRLRVYVPYGPAWEAYSMRRLKENPAIAGHVLGGIFMRR